MFTIFRYSLARMLGQIMGWGFSLAIYGAYLTSFYDVLIKPDVRQQYEQIMAAFPKELMAFFGGVSGMFTPAGFLNLEFFSYMSIVIGIFAVLEGSGLLAADEESGKLDLELAHPVSRAALFFGRLLAFLVSTASILIITWLGFILVIPRTSMPINAIEMARPFLSLFTLLALFGTLALLLSMLLPSRRLAAMTAGLLLVASYFITSLASLDKNLEQINNFSPIKYYQGGLAIDGINWEWVGGLLGFTLLFALLAWWRFERRDIRVGGEGGWKLPAMFRYGGHPWKS